MGWRHRGARERGNPMTVITNDASTGLSERFGRRSGDEQAEAKFRHVESAKVAVAVGPPA